MAEDEKMKIREAWQDSMINVRNLQQAVLKQRAGEKLEDREDAYTQENTSHGISRAEAEYFEDNMYKSLLKSINDLVKILGKTPGDVEEYMIAKHDLERNDVFAMRDAKDKASKEFEQDISNVQYKVDNDPLDQDAADDLNNLM